MSCETRWTSHLSPERVAGVALRGGAIGGQVGGICGGEFDRDAEPGRGVVAEPEFTPTRLHERLADGEPEARAGGARVAAPEARQGGRLVGIVDAGTMIGDRDQVALTARVQPNLDHTPGGRDIDRIVQQVVEHLLDSADDGPPDNVLSRDDSARS